MTANSFTSVSLDPPLTLFCVDRSAQIAEAFLESRYFGVSILRAGQEHLSNRFAFLNEDRFDGVVWSPGHLGCPLIAGALAHLECRRLSSYPAGDHYIVVGEVHAVSSNPGDPLIYYESSYQTLSHEPPSSDIRAKAIEDAHLPQG